MKSWPKEIEKVYIICHNVKEKERYERLVVHLKEVGVPDDVLRFWAPIWGDQLTNEIIFSVTDPFLPKPVNAFSFKSKNLSKGEISLTLNIFTAMRDATENNYSRIIILESDVFLRKDFVERLHQILEDVQTKEWGYISLSEGVGSRPSNVNRSYFTRTTTYDPPHNCVYRCTDSMMFSLAYLKKLSPTLIPFNEPTDWELNFQNVLHQGKALWADPPLVEQGTNYCRMITTLPS